MSRHIDIDRLTEAELIDLNHRIVARLKWIGEARAHSLMLDFRIGQRVQFQPPNRAAAVSGILVKYNRKSVTVIADSGEQWNVSPHFLRPVATTGADVRPGASASHPVVDDASAPATRDETTGGALVLPMPRRGA